jgi:two-component system chemotaxis response regulator CheY
LVVDDSPTLVKFVSYSLKSSGYDVVGACDGMDALEKVSNLESDIDLVITDLNMPNIDGYELIATLRTNEKFAKTPIIILSSEEGEEDKQKGEEVGATSYLVKPFKSSLLLAEVARLLD